MTEKHPYYGAFLVFSHVICGLVSFIFMDKVFMLDSTISPVNAMFWGFSGAALAAGITLLSRAKTRKLVKEEFLARGKLILTISIITSTGAIMWAWSLREANAGSVGLLGKADILITLALGAIFLKEKFTTKKIIGTAISLIGMSLIVSLPKEISLHVASVIILTQLLFGLQSYLVKRSGQTLKGIPFTFWRVTFMSCFLFIGAIITDTFSLPSTEILWMIFVAQLFGAYIGRVAYFEAHKYLEIGKISLLTLSQPILLLLGSWLILNEPMPTPKLIGASILVIGLLIIILEKNKSQKKFSLNQIFAKLRKQKNDIQNPTAFQ